MKRRNGRSGLFCTWLNMPGTMEALLEIPPKLTRNMVFDPEKSRTAACRGACRALSCPNPMSKEVLAAYGLPVIRTETANTEEEASRVGPGHRISAGHETEFPGHHA